MPNNDPPAERLTEVYLQPGDFYFGGRSTRMHTLLGSCVAITLWHPFARTGGMCHYTMPGGHPDVPVSQLDAHYAADAVAMFVDQVRSARTRPYEWEARMFGGATLFPSTARPAAGNGLPARNIRSGIALLELNGFTISAQHFGGNGHRQVIFDLGTGDVELRSVDTHNQVGTAK